MSSILRPGISTGLYPQQLVEANSWDKFLAKCKRPFKRPGGGMSLQRLLEKVDAASADLNTLAMEALGARNSQVRAQLVREGLTTVAVTEAFAVIREVSERLLRQRHYDVQLFAAWSMLYGQMAEMATGEGKSLTATLTAATAAMADIPVHVITTNEYLAARDANEFAPLYQALGLSVSAVNLEMSEDERRLAYACDVVYCTSQQVTFDYLRDRLVMGNDTGQLALQLQQSSLFGAEGERKLLLRGLCFAVVDEADSVLIDEARTPLIISQQHQDAQQEAVYAEALDLARQLTADEHYVVHERERHVELTEACDDYLESVCEEMGGIWQGQRRRRWLISQALTALTLYTRDQHYLVGDGKVKIIDLHTGRLMEDRSWEQGLHQLIECKEGCELSGQRETIARISYQRFFRRYLRLGGMSGTLSEVSDELHSIYGVEVVDIPLRNSNAMQFDAGAFYLRKSDKWLAIVKRIKAIHRSGRPILIGTCSVADSELLAKVLSAHKLPHTVLNARQDADEAEIVAKAGQRGAITVATNMAGRGTDIKLAEGVAELGGLHVLAAERNESQRIDRQLFGRTARHGQAGSCEVIMSLGDGLLTQRFSPGLRRQLAKLVRKDRTLPLWLARTLTYMAQRSIQKQYALMRKDLLAQDDQLAQLLAFSGRME